MSRNVDRKWKLTCSPAGVLLVKMSVHNVDSEYWLPEGRTRHPLQLIPNMICQQWFGRHDLLINTKQWRHFAELPVCYDYLYVSGLVFPLKTQKRHNHDGRIIIIHLLWIVHGPKKLQKFAWGNCLHCIMIMSKSWQENHSWRVMIKKARVSLCTQQWNQLWGNYCSTTNNLHWGCDRKMV